MSDMLDLDTLRRITRGHLESIRAAGIDWLPLASPIELRLTAAAASPIAPASPPKVGAAAIPAPPPPAEPSAAPASNRQALELLVEEVAKCTRCPALASTRTQTVFGQGALEPEVCFLGEAPGADEDAQGLPFVGEAGQLLNRMIAAMGFKREEVYICNILKCRPPGNRTPMPDEAANCRGFLERQLAIVQPKFICCLGATAATHLLNTTLSVGKLRGRFHDYKGTPVAVTYHPAYLLPHRSPQKKGDVWEDLKKILERMGRPVPQKASR